MILVRPSSPSGCQNDVMDLKALYKLWSNKQMYIVLVGFFVISNLLWVFRSGSSLEIVVSYHGAGVCYESFLWFLCSSVSISTYQVLRVHPSCGLGMWQEGGHRVLQLFKWDVSDSINLLQVRAEDWWAERSRSSVEKSVVGQLSWVMGRSWWRWNLNTGEIEFSGQEDQVSLDFRRIYVGGGWFLPRQ